ncbi:hypothetical protein GCM10011487_12520 [Steroidobacter agaridevorans]|uniref:Uncharacterized protein n=1 Tax=Steroidobacter agaridevorans TaxID=2695856 RepID=A0A829Y9H9_9GAMM|nr:MULTISPECIES: hypothetical protein [Steroidobacteraceae]GFE79252.1 hypothetical protein GCM10011487_12520 [Steroidobacter agaridevorans]
MKRTPPKAKKGRKSRKADRSQSKRVRASAPVTVEAKSITDLVETCRAKVAKLIKPTEITYRTLFEYYDYEGDEPELWQCCRLVCQLLKQTDAALIQLGITPYKIFASECADIATGCEAQQRWLRPGIHVVRSIIYVLLDQKAGQIDEIVPQLRDLERELNGIIGALGQVIGHCHQLVNQRAAR